MVDCDAQVTAGSGGTSVRTPPDLRAKSLSLGVASPIRFGDSATMLRTHTGLEASAGRTTLGWYGEAAPARIDAMRTGAPWGNLALCR